MTAKTAIETSTSSPSTTIKPSTPPLPTMGDDTEKSTPPFSPLESVKPCALMGLPVEVRNKILGNLLPNVLEIKIRDGFELIDDPEQVLYRPGDEACYTAILRVNHQLYTEGTAILYNRAFRVFFTHKILKFLRLEYSVKNIREPMLGRWMPRWARYILKLPGYVSKLNEMFTFPFHRVKQAQIELWAPAFRYKLFDLQSALIEFCSILYGQGSLQNVRVDFYDRSYRPRPSYSYDDILYDDDEPHPAQDKHHGEMII